MRRVNDTPSLFPFYIEILAFEPLQTTESRSASNPLFIFTLTLLTSALTSSADSADSAPHSEIFHRQNQLIRMSLNEYVIYCFRGDVAENADVCTWEQVGCTDGVVTSIWLQRAPEYWLAEIYMEWLPPTLQFIHVSLVCVPNLWKHICLPRDLRYLYLWDCEDLELSAELLDLARLRRRMEELILMASGVCGVIHFVCLPETMRLVHIWVPKAPVKFIIVDYDSLPSELKGLRNFTLGMSKIKIKEIGKPHRVKLETKYHPINLKEESTYFDVFYQRFD